MVSLFARSFGPMIRILLGVGIIVLAVKYLDNPAATWAHQHFRRPDIFNRLSKYADPLPTLAAIVLGCIGVAGLFRPFNATSTGRTTLAACIAVLVGESVKEQLKYLFGRPWPEGWPSGNPTWIGTHSSAFQYFHGGTGWESFPSGHMTQMAAIATVAWIRLPRLRWLGVAVSMLMAGTLWYTNYHFIGDILAGALLGILCGRGVTAVVCSPRQYLIQRPTDHYTSTSRISGREGAGH